MKFMILLLTLSLAVPPVQAAVCAQEQGPVGETHMEHPMDHSQAAKHDCCDTEEPEGSAECNEMDDCSGCLSATSFTPALPVVDGRLASRLGDHLDVNVPGLLSPSHSALPFRPPIA